MAKSRQQRRARRAEQAAAAEPRVESRRAERREARADAPPREREAARAERPARGSFVRESWGELKKVEWPDRPQVMTGTVVVIVACALVGAYLWVADLAFKNLVERVLI